ncbi:hypothetical protein CISIN_1g034035mg [Citrus sinensis]|uniref:Uncharacterized protein n=1 Tax=Citrus sinensis TaxID=2711 RepID=A0A067GGU3_CITSI|nr:hypothetical protein CISIN_1g034035mg [Citrus sinensis]
MALHLHSRTKVGTGFLFSRMLQGSKTGDTKNINHTYDFLRKGCPNHLLIKYQQVTNAMVCLLIFPQLMLIMTNHEVSYEAAGNELGHEPPLNLKVSYLLSNPYYF